MQLIIHIASFLIKILSGKFNEKTLVKKKNVQGASYPLSLMKITYRSALFYNNIHSIFFSILVEDVKNPTYILIVLSKHKINAFIARDDSILYNSTKYHQRM